MVGIVAPRLFPGEDTMISYVQKFSILVLVVYALWLPCLRHQEQEKKAYQQLNKTHIQKVTLEDVKKYDPKVARLEHEAGPSANSPIPIMLDAFKEGLDDPGKRTFGWWFTSVFFAVYFLCMIGLFLYFLFVMLLRAIVWFSLN